MAPFRVAASPELPEMRKVAVPSSAKVSLPALRSGDHPEVQRIWIHCSDLEEAQELKSFCQNCRRPKFIAQLVEKQDVGSDFVTSLKRCVPKIPPPYVFDDWPEFTVDAAALLTASMTSNNLLGVQKRSAVMSVNGEESFRHLQSMRWPALLVTDREKLAHALADVRLRMSIAEVNAMQAGDLLPVVLASDFGVLTGNMINGPPVEECEPLAFQAEILAARAVQAIQRETGGESRQQQPNGQRLSDSKIRCKSFTLRPGVYLQRPSPLGGVDAEAQGSKSLFGARALSLRADGFCGYCALSLDGIRSVELTGPWNVINGHLVLGATCGHSSVSHFQLCGASESRLVDITYSEPAHISLEEFESEFVPLDLADCMPEGSEHLWTGLVEVQDDTEDVEEDPSDGLDASAELDRIPSSSNLQKTLSFASGAEVSTDPTPGHGALVPDAPPAPPSLSRSITSGRMRPTMLVDVEDNEADSRSQTPADEPPMVKSLSNTLKTPQHALFRIATGFGEQGAQDVEEQNAAADSDLLGGLVIPSSPTPKLLGKSRGISRQKVNLKRSRKSIDSPSFDQSGSITLTGGLEFISAVQSLGALRTKSRMGEHSGASYATCPLKPGTYHYQVGKPEDEDCKHLEMILHADGSCKYHDLADGSTLRSFSGATVWRVADDVMVVDSKKPGTNGLSLKESRGTRMIERRAACTKIPVEVLRRCSQYTPFTQQYDPFPGHTPADESQRIFGMIDPDSPVLRSMRCRPDRIPYLAFEQELRRHGLACDKIISDFHFLDRDEDWQVSVTDMRRLETYGSPVAAPEVLDELRDALLLRYGNMETAFEALSSSTVKGRVNFTDFEEFLLRSAEDSSGQKVLGSPQKVQEWVENTNSDDRAAVFATLNPNCNPSIDLKDFMSLNLHAAVVALRRLEHFQGWICEQFGRSIEAYAKVFRALDQDSVRMLSRKAFGDGLQRLGYPFAAFASSMFTLLDHNFTGEISMSNFKKLSDFSAPKMLMSLQALKLVVDESFRGVDECYRWMLTREMALQGLTHMPRLASFAAFQTMCRKVKFSPGFGSARPDMDLRMLFLFLDLASGKQRSDGFLTKNEWSLLKGLDSRSLAGSPARLRRIIQQEYGGMDRAFELMHTAWLERALPQGLRQTALTRLARVLSSEAGAPGSPSKASSSPISTVSNKPRHGFLPSVRAPHGLSRQASQKKLGTSSSLPMLGMQRSQSTGGLARRL